MELTLEAFQFEIMYIMLHEVTTNTCWLIRNTVEHDYFYVTLIVVEMASERGHERIYTSNGI